MNACSRAVSRWPFADPPDRLWLSLKGVNVLTAAPEPSRKAGRQARTPPKGAIIKACTPRAPAPSPPPSPQASAYYNAGNPLGYFKAWMGSRRHKHNAMRSGPCAVAATCRHPPTVSPGSLLLSHFQAHLGLHVSKRYVGTNAGGKRRMAEGSTPECRGG